MQSVRHWILLSRGTDHAATNMGLLSYRGKCVFRFVDLPYDVRKLLLRRCLEQTAGEVQRWPAMRSWQERLGLRPSALDPPALLADSSRLQPRAGRLLLTIMEGGILFGDRPSLSTTARAWGLSTLPGDAEGEKGHI
eukprot:gene7591-8391_t